MKICVLKKIGNSSNLIIKNIKESTDLGPYEVLLKQYFIGVGFDDILYRKGVFKLPEAYWKTDLILGLDGVGEIIKVGSAVNGFRPGAKVAYAFSNLGGYAEMRKIDYRYLVSIPDNLALDSVAGSFRRSLTAEYLLFRLFQPNKGEWILIHSVAGGLGYLLAKWAKHIGLKVIGTIGDESKISIALSTGADYVINRDEEDIYKKVNEYTGGLGVRAVYDGIGKSVLEKSLACLKLFGIYISYGYAGGVIENINPAILRQKSLFFTSPVLSHYRSNRMDLLFNSATIFDLIKRGILLPNISKYNFESISQAHTDLEYGKTTGSIVVTI